MSIQPTTYKGAPGWHLSSGALTATVLRRGAKVQSLCWQGKELLWQNRQSEQYAFSSYGDIFETGEFSGFDDMFPNVAASPYPGGVWNGTPLPDHGEVWTQDWDCAVQQDALLCTVHGVRLPYRLEKRVSLAGGNALVLEYRAENLSAYPLKYIWAAHPLFVLEEGLRLDIPGCREIINACWDPISLGAYGAHHPWPVASGGRDLSRLSPQNGCFNKYYVWGPLPQNRSTLRYAGGPSVTLSAPADAVPYLGVWTDEGGYGGYGMACAAPEPATGAMDRLDTADLFGQVSVLPPQGAATWHLHITLE
ncbi:hypothetical protein LJB76_02040 [Clostridia bacterium OttesenSCG-928-O13]|nr:hypothetical protein [Clostridia bacterium OttesenSCG-928-O13]